MKCVVLAVTLLLAIGCQAATVPDVPSQLQHIRSAVDVYLTQVKESAKKALDQLDDTEYRELKTRLTERLDAVHNNFRAWQKSVSPVTDSVVTTIADATAELRESIQNDINTLKLEMEPHRQKLKDVISEHIEEYRAVLEPIMTTYQEKHAAEMEAMKAQIEPAMEKLKTHIESNVEETKNALEPMVKAVRIKMDERLAQMRELVSPYVEEYKDMIDSAYVQAQSITADDLQMLREKVVPLVEGIKEKLHGIFEAVSLTFNKNTDQAQ